MKNFADFTFVKGGKSRQESLINALKEVKTPYVLVSDHARGCVPKEMVDKIIENKNKADCIVPYLTVSDTVVYENETIDREKIKLIQTPQLSKTDVLKKALESNTIYTDESSAIKAMGGSVFYVKGSHLAHKLTFKEDIEKLPCLKPPSKDTFVGYGFDIHPFEKNKAMYLCGIKIREDFGFKAHSDGDVALHALIDSLLGAAGAGDIGELFPDSDLAYKDIDSKILLKNCVNFIKSVGFTIINTDITIIAQKPKLLSFKEAMRKEVASLLGIEKHRVNIKATTAEKLGFIGREEGVAVSAVSTLKFYQWMEK
jgi:2-C-methyl-D-erythritol 4-phosphate cytidylyltransferase/2-C-methyl-D-erythritol 2,4-cyclodiphosphate synthase